LTKEQIIRGLELSQATVDFFEKELLEAMVEVEMLDSQSYPDEKELQRAFDRLVVVYTRARIESEILNSLEEKFKKLSIYKKGSFSKDIYHGK